MPTNCLRWFDGCNTYVRNEFDQPELVSAFVPCPKAPGATESPPECRESKEDTNVLTKCREVHLAEGLRRLNDGSSVDEVEEYLQP